MNFKGELKPFLKRDSTHLLPTSCQANIDKRLDESFANESGHTGMSSHIIRSCTLSDPEPKLNSVYTLGVFNNREKRVYRRLMCLVISL